VPVLAVLLFVEGTGLVTLLAVVAIVRPSFPGTEQAVAGVLAGIAGVLALGMFYRALSIGSMSIVAPIASTGAVVPVVVGILQGDRVTVLIGAGLLVAFLGIMLASREGGEGGEEEQEERSSAGRLSIVLALGAALGFGLFFTGYDRAADGGVLWATTLARLGAVPVVALAVIATRTRLPRGRDAWGLTATGQLDCGSTALYALAATKADLVVVAVVGSLYPVVTVLLARTVLKERMRTAQGIGVAAALLGVVLVSLGSA
jgi:drug/metabolite transporter (DMT)-like permease